VTGHRKADQSLDLDWNALASPNQTRVFYMGLSNASTITDNLMHHGVPGSCPVALIERGTTNQQRMAVTSLAELPATAERDQFQPPTLIIVGGVVALAGSLRPSRNTPNRLPMVRAHQGV
jgi:siroheme synthase